MAARKKTMENAEFFLNYGIDIKNRRVFLEGDIEEDLVGAVIRGIMLMMEDNDEKPLEIYINSCGGVVYEGFALYDFLVALSCPVHTICFGKAMSMALIVYLAGDKRFSSPRATFMNHSSAGVAGGKVVDMKNDVKEIDRLEGMCYDILAERTKHNRQWWAKSSKYEDSYYDYEKAKKLGIVTE